MHSNKSFFFAASACLYFDFLTCNVRTINSIVQDSEYCIYASGLAAPGPVGIISPAWSSTLWK